MCAADDDVEDEEEGISKERVNNFSNKNMMANAHQDSNMHTRGSAVAKDRNFHGGVNINGSKYLGQNSI